MKAAILAGGKGTRLKPYTTVIPKPLMPIGDRAIIEVVIAQLKKNGFTDITLAVGYLSELFMAYFGDGQKHGVPIKYSKEDKPLGTSGPLGQIKGLTEAFLVMNGDILTDLNYKDLMSYHKKHKAAVTIAVHQRKVPIDYGIIEVGNGQEVRGYTEKPTLQYTVSIGINVMEPKVIGIIREAVEQQGKLDFPDLIKILISRKEKVIAYPFEGYWLDIGRPDDYAIAVEEFSKNPSRFLP
ncbi:NTP transferase domain-containing protein [Candidatus Woesearchaeota archaeon]|nr:NTP transferase domain-containing protein [Candidatus Woesearchaeota archaeon]